MSRFSDEELAKLVGEATTADREVPTGWRDAARAAYGWRTVDEELLALTHDSLVEAGAPVRGAGETRTLEFTGGGGLTLEVELSDDRVSGRWGSVAGSQVVLEAADGSRRSTTTDESGFFTLDSVEHGLARFAVGTDGQRLVTEWTRL